MFTEFNKQIKVRKMLVSHILDGKRLKMELEDIPAGKGISSIMISRGKYSRNYRRETMDAENYLMDLNPKSKERKTLNYLLDRKDDSTNKVTVSLTTSSKRQWFYQGSSILVRDGIIRKMSKDTYMINPFFYVPYKLNDEIVNRWDNLYKEKPNAK